MESTKEAVMKKGKRPLSPTRYKKRMPTYVVALAVPETLDDPQKVKLVTNKHSSENSTLSIKSISPTDSLNSTKTFTVTPTEKLSSVLDIATVSEVKIDILDENQCGDVTEKKPPQISSYVVIDNMTADEQPKVICNAPKHIKKCKDTNRFPRKKPKRVIMFKNIHFKYKKPKNGITRRLEKYYEKTKLNTPNAEQIQKQIYSNVLSAVVSRSQVLKKVLTKENLIADSDRISPDDGDSIFDYIDKTLNSSSSTTKKSFTSYTSQNTLVRKDSSTLINKDFDSKKTAHFNIHVTTDNPIPYKSEMTHVALAVAFDESKKNIDQTTRNSIEKLIHEENLTSSETFSQNNTTVLTSKPSSSEKPKYYTIDYDDLCPVNLNPKVQSNATITQEVKFLAGVYSDDETFVIARTSSDYNNSSIQSDCTLTFNSETKSHIENVPSSLSTNDEFSNNNSEKTTLVVDQSSFFRILVWLKKLKNLGYYPMQTSSIGSGANIGREMNDVLVTDNIINSMPLTSKNINDDIPTDTKKKSVLRKPIEVKINDVNYHQNNISLPNDVTIKANLKEVGEDKLSDNVRNTYPTDLADMWERLTLVLDLALKRLEDTLADRIVKDIRASLTISNLSEPKEPTIEIQRTKTAAAPVSCEKPIPIMLHKGIFVIEEHLKRDVDMCVQCDLVQKQVIDQLMLKLSVEAPKPIPSSVQALKVLQPPEIVKDYVEILKPRVAQAIDSASVEVGKADMVTVSTATTELLTVNGFSRFKLLFSGPLAFLRANMVVLTSVPTFFIVLFCLYGVIVIIMKP